MSDNLPTYLEIERVALMAWRDIASAPSNVLVLLYCPDRGCEGNRARIELDYASHGWNNEVANNMSYHAWATMWMPLPPPPSVETIPAEPEG